MLGSYVLVIKNEEDQKIRIGKLGEIFFKKDFYCYIGSALNGLEQRINRHLRKNKKMHWHIDYFLNKTKITDVFIKESKNKEECKIANVFNKKLKSIADFGCSDCSCSSHLFYGSNEEIVFVSKSLKLISMYNF